MKQLVERANPQQRAEIADALEHWRKDADLSVIRDSELLELLSEEERKVWQSLWREVETLIERTRGG